LDRRDFIRRSSAAALTLSAGAVAHAAAPRVITIRVAKTGTVASVTKTTQKHGFDKRHKTLFTRVGALQGNLQYMVNGRLIPKPAHLCTVKKGNIITWRKV
jgi:hypothetical protein